MSKFSRLVRFVANNGKTYHGDAILPTGSTNSALAKSARVIIGDIFTSYTITNEIQPIKRLLTPLSLEQVKTVRCLGLNYAEHARESGMPLPKYPVLFYKPVTSLSAGGDEVPVHRTYWEKNADSLDYECELVVIIGKKCQDVSASSALDYVLGYSIGNDISHRDWQLNGGAGQWSHGKSPDGWAPYGPAIVSPTLIPNPQNLAIGTKVNGITRQENNTKDMIFGVAETIEFLSKGTTLLPGDIIFTGTPQGVAMGVPKGGESKWVRDGDVMEVWLEGVGSIENRVRFLKTGTAARPKL